MNDHPTTQPEHAGDRAAPHTLSTLPDGESGAPERAATVRWWSQPTVLAVVALAVASLVSLTASSSERPPERIAIALIIAGAVVTLFAGRDRRWRMVPAGLALLTGGGFLLTDGPRYIEPVTTACGIVVLLVGLAAGRFSARRSGRLAGVVTLLIFAAAAATFVTLARELIALSLGVIGTVGVTVAAVGLTRARAAGELDSSLGLARVFVLGARTIGDHAFNSRTEEPIRHKVLYEGPDRQHRLFRFVMLMGFASAIASLGVIVDSTAVVIGAMLVAPLLIPLMGMSLSLVLGWTEELRRAGAVVGIGAFVAIGVGFLVSAIFGRGTDVAANTEIASRISPTLLDLGTAIAAGAAGAYALSRRDISDALPGVAVAIALVPPLAVVGVTAELGATSESLGALLLFGTNALAIVAMGALTFIVTGTAAAEAARRWTLDWWTIGFGAIAVVVIAALAANTSSINDATAQADFARVAVEEWIDDRDYDVISVEIDGDEVTVVLSGPTSPDDLDDLGEALSRALQGTETVDIRIAITESTTLTFDA